MFPTIVVPSGTPKWMVYNLLKENPIRMDDLGLPLFLETPMSFAHLFHIVVLTGKSPMVHQHFTTVSVNHGQPEGTCTIRAHSA